MSKVRSDNISNRADDGAPVLVYGAEVPVGYGITGAGGINITGVATATTFSGALSGNATSATSATTATTATNAQGLTGTPSIVVGSVTGTTGSFSGNVSVGGTLTYEDVTNIDSVGIVTARTGIKVLAGGINAAGISTLSGSTFFTGGLVEKYENAGTTLGAQTDNPLSDGNVILFTGNESGAKTINFTGVHSVLSSGESVSFTAIITPNNSGYIGTVQVDGQTITPQWSGGSAPGGSDAGSSGRDVYTFTIFKTGNGTSDYVILGALANYDT